MKYRTLASFKADHKRLKREHQRQFAQVVSEKFAPACDAWQTANAANTAYIWPKSLRVSELVGAAGIMEMTWSFASPDGRATFQFIREDDEWFCVWRRIGDHDVYSTP